MSKLTYRDMDATVVFLDLEELWMGSTGDTILAFGCCYIHFCFIVVVIGYIMSLVKFIVIVAVTAIGYKNSVVIWLSIQIQKTCPICAARCWTVCTQIQNFTNTNTNPTGAARCMTGATQLHPACSSRCSFIFKTHFAFEVGDMQAAFLF